MSLNGHGPARLDKNHSPETPGSVSSPSRSSSKLTFILRSLLFIVGAPLIFIVYYVVCYVSSLTLDVLFDLHTDIRGLKAVPVAGGLLLTRVDVFDGMEAANRKVVREAYNSP